MKNFHDFVLIFCTLGNKGRGKVTKDTHVGVTNTPFCAGVSRFVNCFVCFIGSLQSSTTGTNL